MKLLIILSCCLMAFTARAQAQKDSIYKSGYEPVYFIDSVQVSKETLKNYNPQNIKSISVYKGNDAIRLIGPAGRDGVVYIETKTFAKEKAAKQPQ